MTQVLLDSGVEIKHFSFNKDWNRMENCCCLPVVVHWSEAWQDVSETAVPVQFRLTLSPLY